MKNNLLPVLTGPTAVGKTDLSIKLAKELGGEIISADSMQVYKYMDIGSAKITKDEMQGVRHHLVDCLSPFDDFHVKEFQKMAKDAIGEIRARGKIPILVGGTGFYIQAVLYDIDFTQNDNNSEGKLHHEIREKYETILREKGVSYLHGCLKEIDFESSLIIHENNSKRVIRALEFYEMTGTKISEHNEAERLRVSPYDFSYFVLNDERAKLYERINKRVDKMINDGLVEEVTRLKAMGCNKEMVSMQGLGYKEILDYLEGNISLEDAVSILKRDTRHFAKRQLTWFRREKSVIWLDKQEFDYDDEKILEYMLSKIQSTE